MDKTDFTGSGDIQDMLSLSNLLTCNSMWCNFRDVYEIDWRIWTKNTHDQCPTSLDISEEKMMANW